MRSMWQGAVSFGLVSIPIKLYAATEPHDVSLHQVHASDGGRIRYRRVCEIEDKEVPYHEIAKGYQVSKEETVVLSDDDLAQLPLPSTETIEVLRFVPASQIDGLYVAKSYYLEADRSGGKPYVLLRDALEQAETVALVKVALRRREALAVLRPRDELLVMHTMWWPDEVRDATALAPPHDIKLRKQELQMAASYIATLSGDFAPEDFTDDYATALAKLVEEKSSGAVATKAPKRAKQESNVIDLMEALQQSAAKAKKKTGRKAPRKASTRQAA